MTEVPDPELLAMLDTDPQGWVVAQAVRDDGQIVDFVLVYINDAGCRLVGRPCEELVGRRYRQLWPETVNDETLPMYRSVVETRRQVTRTVYYDRASIAGHFELRIGPYGDGFVGRFVDLRQITVSPQSRAGTRLYDMLDAAFDGFTVLRPITGSDAEIVDFACEYVNQWGAKLAGHAVEDVIGHQLSEIAPDSWENGLFERYRDVSLTGRPWRQQLRYPEISQVWEINIARHGADSVAVSFREITEQVQREQRLADSVAQAEHSAARARALETVTAALVAASTTDQVYTAIGSVLRPSAGGEGLVLLLRDNQHLRLHHHSGYEPDVLNHLQQVPMDHPYPATVVARTGRPCWLTSLDQFHAAQASTPSPVPPGDRQAWAFLPLTVAGDVLGTLVVGYAQPREFDTGTRSTLTALARLGAQALQRALLYETSISIAGELQHALLPAQLPDTPGLQHAARYLPWTRGAEVGGDWYDLITVRDGVIALVIGDVAGHNTAAAAAMGQVRDALRAYAVEGHRPAQVVQRASGLIRSINLNTIATCCYIELDVAAGAATAVLAGHPPPLLRDKSGTRLLALPADPPLGAISTATYRNTRFAFHPGATLLLYTDGLVEDHRYPVDRGFNDLCEALRHAPTDRPGEILDHLLAGNVGPRPQRDDVALLCVTRSRSGAGAPGRTLRDL